ncbi:MAG: hypothetical protein AB8C84_02290 [Oligoflexales bacterium]
MRALFTLWMLLTNTPVVQAVAIFDFQVLSGRRVVNLEGRAQSQDMRGKGQGSSMSLATHWNIDPNIPVAIGASTARESIYFSHVNSKSSDVLYGYSFKAEVYTWFPLQSFAPYARFSSLISSQYERLKTHTYQPNRTSYGPYSNTWSEKGHSLGLGCAFTLAPSVGALLEWQKSFHSFLQSNQNEKIALNSQNLRAGIEIGL